MTGYYIAESVRRSVQMVFGMEIFDFPFFSGIRHFFYRLVFNIGKSPVIQRDVRLFRVHGKKDGKIKIGKRVLLAEGLSLDYSGGVEIGDNVWLSEDVMIHTHIHLLNERRVYSKPGEIKTRPLKIGDFVWIGSRVVILPGVESIGRNSIVGAGSVVTKDVPEDTVIAGNPAKIIKKLSYSDNRRKNS